MAKEAKKTEAKKPEGKKADTAPKPVKEIVTVKSGALSTDVGPMVLAGLDKSYKEEQKAQAILQEVEGKRYDLLAQTTQAIVKAVKADDSINLSAAFSGDPKAMNRLNDQIGLALGFREVTETAPDKNGQIIRRVAYAKAVTKYFPGPKDDKNSAETKRKATLRTNFLHLVKKCAQAAAGITANDLTLSVDKASGTLALSGPKIAETFGAEKVLLNEKKQVGEGEAAVTLKEKPSFTAIAKMGAAAAGKTMQTRVDSRASVSGSNATDPNVALQQICASLAKACEKIKGAPDDATKRSLSIALSAIDKVMKQS